MSDRHPILSERMNLGIYLSAYTLCAFLVAALVYSANKTTPIDVRWAETLSFLVPLSTAYAFLCLVAWWGYRNIPWGLATTPQLIATHIFVAALAAQLLALGARGWSRTLGEIGPWSLLGDRFRVGEPLWFLAGLLLYGLATAFHYVAQLTVSSGEAENKALAMRMRTREAELRAYQAQVEPHFLFNCLNSLSALCSLDGAAARRMTLNLAEFFRGSLKAGKQDWLRFGEELRLIERYLEIEKVRFEERLKVEVDAEQEALSCQVPSLLLQPLVENAIKHGIAPLIEGGVIHITARKMEDCLKITVTNPCDPERPKIRGAKVGLANVHGRLLTLYGPAASFTVIEKPERFQVTVTFPAVNSPAASVDSQTENQHHG